MSRRLIGNRYSVERSLGGGGMGHIWVAQDSQLQRQVALKVMAPHFVASPAARYQFSQEAKAIAQLHNPHVVQVYDYGVDEGTPYIVMELLEGEDLETRLLRQGRLPLAAVASVLNQTAKALAAAHAAGVIHRDLKPANLFLARVDTEEVLKVLDFGLARLSTSTPSAVEPPGHVMGTPRYMSPEQRSGGVGVDHRSDLWSLAVMAYRALTGQFPFPADVPRELGDPVLPQPPSEVLSELSPEVDAFFKRALETHPSRRFQSASEMAAAFAALLENHHATRAAKILVIDDEPDVALLMKQRFRKQVRDKVYEFVFAADGEDALEKLRQHPDTDVVLSDLNMPRMDGLTFLARVGEVNPLVKVIIVSAYSDMSNIRVAMNRGAFDFLVKPIDFQDLEVTLTKTLQQVRKSRQMLSHVEENHLFRMFVHSSIIERALPLLRGPDVVMGERVEASVAFIDVKNFTPVTRDELPDAAIRKLNANFEVIVPELLAREGVVDKFVGDAVMAVFRGQGHLQRALNACLSARQRLREMATRYGPQSPYAHGASIGLDSGELLSGSVGAKGLRRLDYTVLGETVNTAARLAMLADQDQLLIPERVRIQLEGRGLECTRVGTKRLHGPDEVAIYNVLGLAEVKVSASDATASLAMNDIQRAPTSEIIKK